MQSASVRENAEPIAMYGGGADEAAVIEEELRGIQRKNWQRSLQSSWMSYITGNLDNLTGILPLVICAPAYFNGTSQLGTLQQARAGVRCGSLRSART